MPCFNKEFLIMLLLVVSWHAAAFVPAMTAPSTKRAKINMAESKFLRNNPMSDKFKVLHFHHLEFYCQDSTSTSRYFKSSLGLDLISKSDMSTGNNVHASYACQSGDVRMVFTAPYRSKLADKSLKPVIPGFSPEHAADFFTTHGLGVKAVAVEVDNVAEAFTVLTSNGAAGVLTPRTVNDSKGRGSVDVGEVALYGDVVLRLIDSKKFSGNFLPDFEDVTNPSIPDYGRGRFGLKRIDHVVGNLHELPGTLKKLKQMTGFHEFAEFVSEDVGTVDSGLNSVVLANNNNKVLLPLNEPTFGTRRKSQIQTYLEQNQGEGVQHIALLSNDIVKTMRLMRKAGFEFQDSLGHSYYESLRTRLKTGDPDIYPQLSEVQLNDIEELGILADRDDQGILLQIFTRPVGDRPTLFLEIIQRLGCDREGEPMPGCGGFGKGNFKDLFKSIEVYETKLAIN